jgi:hypothetical protein
LWPILCQIRKGWGLSSLYRQPWRANKIRNRRWYFRLSSSVLDKLMTTAKLYEGGEFQEAEVAHHWHIHRKSRHDLVIAAFIFTFGFAILLALMFYVIPAGN